MKKTRFVGFALRGAWIRVVRFLLRVPRDAFFYSLPNGRRGWSRISTRFEGHEYAVEFTKKSERRSLD